MEAGGGLWSVRKGQVICPRCGSFWNAAQWRDCTTGVFAAANNDGPPVRCFMCKHWAAPEWWYEHSETFREIWNAVHKLRHGSRRPSQPALDRALNEWYERYMDALATIGLQPDYQEREAYEFRKLPTHRQREYWRWYGEIEEARKTDDPKQLIAVYHAYHKEFQPTAREWWHIAETLWTIGDHDQARQAFGKSAALGDCGAADRLRDLERDAPTRR